MSTVSIETTIHGERHPVAAEAAVRPKAASRLLFVDNIRVLLTILVLLFHLMITYAGTGSWYYMEGREDLVTGMLGAWFLAVNQAYFMGLFLLISAYFVPGSYDRKGAGRFLKDRLIRLGIPLALYGWIIRPLLVYLDPIKSPGPREPLWRFLTQGYFRDEPILGSGPLWFIETLLIFSALYALWRLFSRPRPAEPMRQAALAQERSFPGNVSITLLVLFLGVTTFLVRMWLPMGWCFEPLNLQFPYFAQYITLFVIGLIAYRRNWLLGLPDRAGRIWLGMAGLLIVLFWPLMLAGGAIDNGIEAFAGGWHWQAFAYALWESFLCLSMCIGLVYLFRRFGSRQGRLARFLSRNAYAAYLIHEAVITIVAYAARSAEVYPLLKWALASLVALPLCFGLSNLIRRLPYADRVLEDTVYAIRDSTGMVQKSGNTFIACGRGDAFQEIESVDKSCKTMKHGTLASKSRECIVPTKPLPYFLCKMNHPTTRYLLSHTIRRWPMSKPTTQPGYYVIRIKGHLAPRWAEYFAGLTIAHTESGETILSGPITWAGSSPGRWGSAFVLFGDHAACPEPEQRRSGCCASGGRPGSVQMR
ncbi:MAG: acyltransferase [Anaerolineae bacterium]|nr:acyltransferase [Anaerolineae bacterium]